MSTARAQRFLLERLGSGATVLLSIHLALPAVPAWCDGEDADGRAVLLVGRHQLGRDATAQEAMQAVLASFGTGHVPDGVHAVAFAPKASEFIAEVVAGEATEVLADGPRGSGKTHAVPGALAALAELRRRAGEAGPLRVLWLHDSLVNAGVKTGRSLESPEVWAGCWACRDDRRVAGLAVGGVELVQADFIGAQDASVAERLRAECHVVAVEEVVPSLDESGGVEERKYELALTSARLPTRRRVAMLTTNPGDVDTWPHRRFIEGGGRPGCRRIQIPAADRLSPDEITALRASFRDSPDLERRLALGEWAALKLGELVGEGYDPAVHVAPRRLDPSPEHVLGIGWDGGHSPSAVIGQLIGGQVKVYAALNDLKIGVLELIEEQVQPWLIQWAPWWTEAGALVHVIDPSMATGSEATIRASSERMIREQLGGRIVKGPVAWSPRREAVLRVLAPRQAQGMLPLAISPAPETLVLRQALGSRWYYPHTPDGRVDRSRPKKPNSPWADVGDAAAYLLGWLRPGAVRERSAGQTRIIQARTGGDPLGRDRSPRRDAPIPSDQRGARVLRSPTSGRGVLP